MLFLGLDIGAQEAKAIVCDERGEILTRSSRPLIATIQEQLPEEWAEQNPLSWWEGILSCLQEIIASLKKEGIPPEEIRAISVASISGTIIPLGADNEPLRRAIMFNDNRAVEEARLANKAGEQLTAKLGYSFQPSFALSKILWIKGKEPQTYSLCKKFIHAADFIIGKLTGDYSTTDNANALKTGYDLVDKRWPRLILQTLEISSQLLPEVVSPGTVIGSISPECAQETGLSRETLVTAGITNSTASLISAGASSPGEWASVIGATLSIKGVSRKLIKDREGRIHCRLHPQGFWLPGGASSTGGECLKDRFGEDDLAELDQHVPEMTPTHLTVYPLIRPGEKLPFANPEAEGFIIGKPRDKYELYTAYLEGIGLVERWIYELMEELGAPVGKKIYAVGGGSRSKEWLQLRANILNRTLARPKVVEAAFGAAIVAASQTACNGLIEATRKMVRVDLEVEPEAQKLKPYTTKYRKFRDACRAIGYE
ncbi:FGGY-family carbohydrate kinase [candidate division NPL-UPA2 bacterium]|nr:FGGY-family carbohydrate kinase [candidate division NPL-UPA2 bacterium]